MQNKFFEVLLHMLAGIGLLFLLQISGLIGVLTI